jgi:mannose-6-phosphate isomerase-like protein (cupin superfamily)
MKLYTSKNYKNIESSTCGKLIQLLNSHEAPSSIITIENIKPTTNHAHKISTEIYWLEQGNINMEVSTDKEINNVMLESGSILVIHPGEFHRIVSSSDINKLIVISTPSWSPNDEVLPN